MSKELVKRSDNAVVDRAVYFDTCDDIIAGKTIAQIEAARGIKLLDFLVETMVDGELGKRWNEARELAVHRGVIDLTDRLRAQVIQPGSETQRKALKDYATHIQWLAAHWNAPEYSNRDVARPVAVQINTTLDLNSGGGPDSEGIYTIRVNSDTAGDKKARVLTEVPSVRQDAGGQGGDEGAVAPVLLEEPRGEAVGKPSVRAHRQPTWREANRPRRRDKATPKKRVR